MARQEDIPQTESPTDEHVSGKADEKLKSYVADQDVTPVDENQSSLATPVPGAIAAVEIPELESPPFSSEGGDDTPVVVPPELSNHMIMDAEASALMEASYRIGAASQSKEHHSFSSLLVATQLADNSASRWFRRRLSELHVEPSEQKSKLGLTDEQFAEIVKGHPFPNLSAKSLVWTESAKQWVEKAQQWAERRQQIQPTEIAARDLVAAFVFARTFHEEDRQQMGLGAVNEGAKNLGVELANGFLSFIFQQFPNEFWLWQQVFRESFNAEPPLDIFGGPERRLSSDRWTITDRLGYGGYARAIFHFITNPRTEPPMSISIQAPWGAGKTSLMRMIQHELDPDAVEAARAGGWRAWGISRQGRQEDCTVSLGQFLEIIGEGKGKGRSEKDNIGENRQPARALFEGGRPGRYTVWFNAWKYESGDQLWAGLATTIIEQITARMNPFDREMFLLRLQAARIDPGKVRSRIHDLAFSATMTALGKIGIWIRSAIPLALGALIQQAPGLEVQGALPAGAMLSALWVAGEVFKKFGKGQEEAKQMSVSATLKDIASVPDYSAEIGFTHKVVDDLQRIFETLKTVQKPSGKDSKEQHRRLQPIVIFVDDLDRCSPRKVADVIEGVNLFMAGDFMPCVFIIGMDPQMVSAALEKAHEGMTKRLPQYDRQTPIGWRFMDKFIQLPFTIPPPEPDSLEEYTDYLLHGDEVEKIITAGEQAIANSEEVINNAQDARNAAMRAAKRYAAQGEGGDATEAPISQTVVEAAAKVFNHGFALRLQDRISETFSDSDPAVQEMLREAARNFSTNPRDRKRLLNLVRFQYLISHTRVANDKEVPDPEIMGRWVALSLRWPAFVRWLQWSPPHDGETSGGNGGYGVVRRRLVILERLSRDCKDFKTWRQNLHDELHLRKGDVQWDTDPRLRDFFADDYTKPLSEGAGLGFY